MPGAQVHADVWISEYMTPWDVYLHGVTNVLAAAKTEYQSMQIVETGVYGKALVLDGKWQSCTGDEHRYHEPLVQPAFVMHTLANGRAPETALILGGGEGATLREVLRWNSITRGAMVDIDGVVVDACIEHLPEMHRGAFHDPRADVVIGDALAYVADEGTRPHGGWDVVISDLSDPIEDGPSFMLFTKEYFADLKAAMAPGGVLVVQAGPLTPGEQHQHPRLVCTLRSLFASTVSIQSAVPTYPAPWSFIVASDAPIAAPDGSAGASEADRVLAEHLRAPEGDDPGLRVVDGPALAGLCSLPKEIREQIEAETVVYTRADPPKFHGSGTVSA